MITSLDVRKFIETDKYQNYLQEFVHTYDIKMTDIELSSQECNILAGALNVANMDLATIENKLDTDKDFLFKYGKALTNKYEQDDKDFRGNSLTCLIYRALESIFLEQSKKALATHYKNRGFKGYAKFASIGFTVYNEAKQLHEQGA